MSLVELIAQSDERSLAASGLACLDRCLPVLGASDDTLRPLWAGLAEGAPWGPLLGSVRESVPRERTGEAAELTLAMLDGVPAERSEPGLRTWADACSVAALQIHRTLDPSGDGPLAAGELRRQTAVLELLTQEGAGGLRRALDLSTEGRRVLRAVVSRRERGRV
ncbi:hypothetical protein H9Y04_32015 [Streptomyces sp. TRM66268-LWL]|uniref:Uncharacterized protein n=1 Tax=Streptomyces polyasparticus TaxID=2767826 RepID=A0ABR7SNV3_9ACTN|nr:hypothetical protein [Streptomyces polyasparticus]MBC9717165.1 hypothetical protein [Streptomyces polyasparticus]